MKWTPEAEKVVCRVPFFVRGRVRKKVEEVAARSGSTEVCIEHVTACRERFLRDQEDEVSGFRVEACFGTSACPNAAVTDDGLADAIETGLSALDIKARLKAKVQGPLKMHHEFRVSLSLCPNACSRPQIVDVGIIGAAIPSVTDAPCAGCRACVEICREGAVSMANGDGAPFIDLSICLACGACATACPSGTISVARRGYRILVGGKLGRHPRLGSELPGLFSRKDVERIVPAFADLFLADGDRDERFGDLVERTGIEAILSRAAPFLRCMTD